ncbi:hypothetical protein FJZ31_32025 [Candidatus Poribacteria bacterium]|nr:hypothetical protein [Candidatus Poribacteria bacterium]
MPTPWDAVYKQILQRFFQKRGISITTEVEVGRLPRTIDIAIVCSQEESQKLALVSPFTFFAQHNLLEFKSSSDPLTSAEYKHIMARAYLYMAEVGIDNLFQLTVCAVTAGKPIKVLTQLPELVRFSNVSQALYKSEYFPFYVLVIAELAIEEQNYPLLLFSKGRKRRAFLKELVRKRAIEYLRLAYQLYPCDVTEVFSMSKDYPTLEENIQFIIKDLGIERIVQAIPTEQKETVLRLLLEQLGTEKVESILRNDGKRKF